MGQVTELIDVVKNLSALDQEATIYSEEPWTPESAALVDLEPTSGGLPAAASERGMSYFLEVSIAREFLDDWLQSQKQVPTLGKQCERIIYYALHDA